MKSISEIRADFNLAPREEEIFAKIDWARCPRHIAIIMDGNGRWAKKQNQPRTFGHKAGVDSVYAVVEACGKLPVEYVTFYAFSTENWRRSGTEVKTLMNLFSSSLSKYLDRLMEKDVRIDVIGDLEGMGQGLCREFERAREKTKDNRRICMTLAMNYSGRQDLTRVAGVIARKVKNGEISVEEITEEMISDCLYTCKKPDPELLIRTSGEKRLSNFLLWELAYSEFCFQDVLWPDFRQIHLFEAILEFQNRERRFGGV